MSLLVRSSRAAIVKMTKIYLKMRVPKSSAMSTSWKTNGKGKITLLSVSCKPKCHSNSFLRRIGAWMKSL